MRSSVWKAPRPRSASQDYRDTRGSFDGIASIEMIEAVGEAIWPTYFRVLRDTAEGRSAARRFRPSPSMNAFYPDYRSSADFIQRYIFPGGMLPTSQILREQAAGRRAWLSRRF